VAVEPNNDRTLGEALVVDDSKAMRMILSRILNSLGYTVHQAVDGLDGLEQLQTSEGIGLALVDWNMPQMDGIEFVRAVRSSDRFQHVRMLMVSSETDRSRIESALEAGADEYAMKPFDVETIRAKLELIGLGAPSDG
jgi:two-component system, chemotaxis family, chemotaxis protein CheY